MNKKKIIISVVGARPNFVKIAPVHKSFQKYKNDIEHLVCHTGQHFDKRMSRIFFEEFEMHEPDFYLGIGSGTHGVQTARIMIALEDVISSTRPDLVIVLGDVNSTIAASLVAAKLMIPVAHIESGLRSFDKSMPEEINRILTDLISDYLFVTERSGIVNLKNEGIADEKIYFTGNVMIDSLVHYMPHINSSAILEKLALSRGNYILATFHRPSNVDDEKNLSELVRFLNEISLQRDVVFPIHPRTRHHIDKFGLAKKLSDHIIQLDPIGYIDFLSLLKNSDLVITDSGGIQEETTFLGVQCVTVRDTTERPVTCEIGTNHLVGADFGNALKVTSAILSGRTKQGGIPELWDGKASERIVEIIYKSLCN